MSNILFSLFPTSSLQPVCLQPGIILQQLKTIQPEIKMKTLHLVTAVIASINHFHALKLDFSAFDITRHLRDKVSNGDYEITDVDKDTFGGVPVSVIEHAQVREVVKELFDLDLIPDYNGANHFDQNKQVSYVLYSYAKPAAPSTPALTPAVQNVYPSIGITGLLNPAPAPTSAPATTTPAPLKQPDAEMWDKAKNYIDNRPLGATVKQVQSRLKGYAVTCDQIAAFFQNRLVPSTNVSQSRLW